MFWSFRYSKDPKEVARWAYAAYQRRREDKPKHPEWASAQLVMCSRYIDGDSPKRCSEPAMETIESIKTLPQACHRILELEHHKATKDQLRTMFLDCVTTLLAQHTTLRAYAPAIDKLMVRARIIDEEVTRAHIDSGAGRALASLQRAGVPRSLQRDAKLVIEREVSQYRHRLRASLVESVVVASADDDIFSAILLRDDDNEFRELIRGLTSSLVNRNA